MTQIADQTRTTIEVLREVLAERAAQDHTWGEQNHPLKSPTDLDGVHFLGRSYAHLEREAKARFSRGERSGAIILLEEVFEALAAKDLVSARTELVQVAAVAVMLVEGIDRAGRRGRAAADRRGNVRPCDTVSSPLVTGDGTRRDPVDGDDDHPRAGYRADLVITDDVPESDRERLAVGQWTPAEPHPYNGAGRLHGICRCGEGRDAPVHTCPADGCSPGTPGCLAPPEARGE